jgi:hypothetical protein
MSGCEHHLRERNALYPFANAILAEGKTIGQALGAVKSR